MDSLGIVLLLAGLGMAGLGLAGRIQAARLAGPKKSDNVIDEARRLYELPDHGRTVRQLEKSGNRLLVSGASLCMVGILMIL